MDPVNSIMNNYFKSSNNLEGIINPKDLSYANSTKSKKFTNVSVIS